MTELSANFVIIASHKLNELIIVTVQVHGQICPAARFTAKTQ